MMGNSRTAPKNIARNTVSARALTAIAPRRTRSPCRSSPAAKAPTLTRNTVRAAFDASANGPPTARVSHTASEPGDTGNVNRD